MIVLDEKRGYFYRNGILEINEELWDKLNASFGDFEWEDDEKEPFQLNER